MNRSMLTGGLVCVALWISMPAGAAQKTSGDDPVLRWNAVALQAVAEDHSGTFAAAPEQGGPTAASRALAIVHVAIYDAVNAIDGAHEPYIPMGVSPSVLEKASIEAAVAQAARDTLAVLYPSQQDVFDRELQKVLTGIPRHHGRAEGIEVGRTAAMNILLVRLDDGSADEMPYEPGTDPGDHQVDPLNPNQGFLGPGWGLVDTFSGIDVTHPDFRAPAPPALDSEEYALNFTEVQLFGGDGEQTPTLRTEEQTEIGLFWAYDGTKGLGVPPNLYNQAVRTIARQKGNTWVENARLFALLNLAIADAGIATWESKFRYNLWRPIVAIRQGNNDGNDDTIGDEFWSPLGAPASNESGRNFTPPFPAYPSGHASFGGATFHTLASFYGTDEISFRLKSDEMSGRTTDSNGDHRYTVIREFDRCSDAALENAESRIYLGIHWRIDATAGMDQGAAVADYVFQNLLRPVE